MMIESWVYNNNEDCNVFENMQKEREKISIF